MSSSSSGNDLAADISHWQPRSANLKPAAAAPVNVSFVAPSVITVSDGNEEESELHDSELEGSSETSDIELVAEDAPPKAQPSQDIQIIIQQDPDFDRDDYEDCTWGADILKLIRREVKNQHGTAYEAEFEDGHTETISFDDLMVYDNGRKALRTLAEEAAYEDGQSEEEEEEEDNDRIKATSRPQRPGYVDTVEALSCLDDEDTSSRPACREKRSRTAHHDSSDDMHELMPRRSRRVVSTQVAATPATRSSRRFRLRNSSTREITQSSADEDGDDNGDDDDGGFVLQSDVLLDSRKRKRPVRSRTEPHYLADDGVHYDRAPRLKEQRHGVRQSGRATRHQGDMQDPDMNDIYRSESDSRPAAPPKPVGAREYFQNLPRSNPFRTRHMQQCDSCGNGTNYAPLIYCQGCVFSYHKSCISHRSSREHIVTKIGHKDFVLQCRRCIAYPRKKDYTAPDQGKCSDCKEHGASCQPFRERKTTLQEQKEREDNDGDDPIYPVDRSRINSPDNVMFRCTQCYRGFHFEHLPPKSDLMELDNEDVAAQRILEYTQDWRCKECLSSPGKVGSIIAWKPIDEDTYDGRYGYDETDEDEKAYLLRWEGKSYFQATWMPGPWVWGYTAGAMRKAFSKREEARAPKMRTEDAIPEDFLRTDIVLDVKYTSIVDVPGEEIDKARIREVDLALIKFKGLGYEDVVWEKPPTPDDEDRWTDFVTAYNDWVFGKYVKQPKSVPLKTRLEKARASDFTKLEKKKQPDNIIGGELMKYQIDGLNWLYYKWYTQKNAILADEMGLGKTIQIIAFLATLVHDWNCFPFLIIVPNSTCANWRREIKNWAPSLRVVAYFGSKEARDLTYRYELFARESKELRCHIVVTSYECAADDSARRFFRSVPWQAMVVDEGQRLKSDKTSLYSALSSIKVPFKILLTGTPLQNNARELFNLLQFLDDDMNAAELEQRFEDLNQARITELHDMIRPFFLRRTKAQVLTFLPPMAQVIVPVSMSLVQKKLYKSILGKNPDLLRAIFGGARELKASERSSLNNILMQLRKCLCHPFVYNQGIEERNVSHEISHRNLVEASGKLQLLDLLLPKLKERGHRVLIFSQFLDMLNMVEDFLDGLGLQYQRLDGTIGSLQKQKRIDEFNAPDSELFAFLLSTRAGGVGINLATADTVIILDPDFNPHQDIQALSRAHRIGQKKKVRCFQIVTRASAEEKIMQYGRKKMALDHVLIGQMDADDATDRDLEGILRHGAVELFDDDGEKDIKYDASAIDRLLDTSHVEHTQAGEDKSAESTFSFARIWANNELEDAAIETAEAEELAPDKDVWDKILRERERVAAAEAAAAQAALGRGRRAKAVINYNERQPRDITNTEQMVDYSNDQAAMDTLGNESPIAASRKQHRPDDSDTDFQTASENESAVENPENEDVDPNELQSAKPSTSHSKLTAKTKAIGKSTSHSNPKMKTSSRAKTAKSAASDNGTPKSKKGVSHTPRSYLSPFKVNFHPQAEGKTLKAIVEGSGTFKGTSKNRKPKSTVMVPKAKGKAGRYMDASVKYGPRPRKDSFGAEQPASASKMKKSALGSGATDKSERVQAMKRVTIDLTGDDDDDAEVVPSAAAQSAATVQQAIHHAHQLSMVAEWGEVCKQSAVPHAHPFLVPEFFRSTAPPPFNFDEPASFVPDVPLPRSQ
ncbi:hypothetical protein MBLNU459_g0660t2 [Dothideomycetes sp. NU459]